MANSPGRPRGRRNLKPSKAAVAAYYRMLAEAADKGDTTAAGWLCQLDLLNQRKDVTQ